MHSAKSPSTALSGGAIGGLSFASDIEWSSLKNEPPIDDLAVFNGYAFGTRRTLHRHRLGVVHDNGLFVVTKGRKQRRAGEDLYERCDEFAVRNCAFQSSGWRITDDVVGDIA